MHTYRHVSPGLPDRPAATRVTNLNKTKEQGGGALAQAQNKARSDTNFGMRLLYARYLDAVQADPSSELLHSAATPRSIPKMDTPGTVTHLQRQPQLALFASRRSRWCPWVLY